MERFSERARRARFWRRTLTSVVAVGALVNACGNYDDRDPPAGTGSTTMGQGGASGPVTTTNPNTTSSTTSLTTGAAQGGSTGSGGTTQVPTGPALVGAPLLFSATAEGFGINAVMSQGDPAALRVRVRETGASAWGEALQPDTATTDVAEWTIAGLAPGTSYDYQLITREPVDGLFGAGGEAGAAGSGEAVEMLLFEGSQVTQREEGEAFRFALLTDSHIGANLNYDNQGDETILRAVSEEIGPADPDFVVNLGDMLDFHEYGFNIAPPDGSVTRMAYLNYRDSLGATLGNAAHYGVIGNWEGENGNYTSDEIAWSRDARLTYLPGPDPDTYPEGGSPAEDYYAFTWGDALFVVLNVMTYTPTEHLLSTVGGTADDWTLGEEQFEWLETTLENATSQWRFLLIHHAVGGAAGDAANSAYGRGGGQAAHVGEQARVHQLMIDHDVQIFFYGHDHVFTDMVVDDIHYSMPGSAGAIWMFNSYETGYEEYWLGSGWGQVDVTPDSVHVQFIEMGGEVLYEYTLE